MHYINLKQKDLSSSMTFAEIGKLVTYLMELAKLERPITDDELCRLFGGKRSVKSWEMSVKRLSLDLKMHEDCILNACKMVDKIRARNRENKANSRTNKKNVTGDRVQGVTGDGHNKIKEDNINKINKKENSIKEKRNNPTEWDVLNEGHRKGYPINDVKCFYLHHESKNWSQFNWYRGDKWEPSLNKWVIKSAEYEKKNGKEEPAPVKYMTIEEAFAKDEDGNYVN